MSPRPPGTGFDWDWEHLSTGEAAVDCPSDIAVARLTHVRGGGVRSLRPEKPAHTQLAVLPCREKRAEAGLSQGGPEVEDVHLQRLTCGVVHAVVADASSPSIVLVRSLVGGHVVMAGEGVAVTAAGPAAHRLELVT